ncbi:MAG: hypothetical protein HC888_06815 [Candidatus Competibacteraceae bacterium]|nr:hypothetical protein [Candidatus Competibacteraceae bacterium]
MIKVQEADREQAKPWLKRLRLGEHCCFKTTVEGTYEGTESGGIIILRPSRNICEIGTVKPEKSRSQVNLLKQLERMIFFVQNRKQPNEQELYLTHEGIMDLYAPHAINPFTKGQYRKTLSDPSLTTKEMATILEGAFNTLATEDIPAEMMSTDLHSLFANWKEYKATIEEEPMTEQEYRLTHPVCEFTLRMGSPSDPLERIHIIGKGASLASYENSLNYVMGKASIHRRIHAEGWESVLIDFPHMLPKYNRAMEVRNARDSSDGVPATEV